MVPFSFAARSAAALALASCWAFLLRFHFIRRFWNHIFTCNSYIELMKKMHFLILIGGGGIISEAVNLILVPTHLVILVDVKLKWQRNLLEFDIKLLDGLVEAGFIEYLWSPNAWHQANILRSLMSSNSRWADLILSLLLILTVLMCNVQTIYCFRLKFLNFLL